MIAPSTNSRSLRYLYARAFGLQVVEPVGLKGPVIHWFIQLAWPNVSHLQKTGSKSPRFLFQIDAVNATQDMFSLPAVQGTGTGHEKLSNNHLHTALRCYRW